MAQQFLNAGLSGVGISPVQTTGSVALTDAATIATDCSGPGNYYTVTLGGNRTLGAPTNAQDGLAYYWQITQDGTGGRTLAFNAIFATSPPVNLTAAAVTVLGFVYSATLAKFQLITPTQLAPCVVAKLPTASGNQGVRGIVTDSNATTFMNTVAGSGASIVPVVIDGTNWKIG